MRRPWRTRSAASGLAAAACRVAATTVAGRVGGGVAGLAEQRHRVLDEPGHGLALSLGGRPQLGRALTGQGGLVGGAEPFASGQEPLQLRRPSRASWIHRPGGQRRAPQRLDPAWPPRRHLAPEPAGRVVPGVRTPRGAARTARRPYACRPARSPPRPSSLPPAGRMVRQRCNSPRRVVRQSTPGMGWTPGREGKRGQGPGHSGEEETRCPWSLPSCRSAGSTPAAAARLRPYRRRRGGPVRRRGCGAQPGSRATVGTGLAVAVRQLAAFVHPLRPGLAARHHPGQRPGTVDAGYRGKVRGGAAPHPTGTSRSAVRRGDASCQLIVQPVTRVRFLDVAELPATPRGEGRLRVHGAVRWLPVWLQGKASGKR